MGEYLVIEGVKSMGMGIDYGLGSGKDSRRLPRLNVFRIAGSKSLLFSGMYFWLFEFLIRYDQPPIFTEGSRLFK